MKNESLFAKKFLSLYRRMKKATAVDPGPALDPISQLVLGLLEWDSTSTAARAAYDRLMGQMVDHNDLRVSHPQEIRSLIGQRYPKAEERVRRLLSALQEIYVREYAVSLDTLANKPKKEVRAYLDSLPGMPPYAAAQVTLLCFGGHAVPVDDVMIQLLRRQGVVDSEASVEQAASFLERQIRASDAIVAHGAMRAWADSGYPSLFAKAKVVTKKAGRVSRKVTKKVASASTRKTVKKKTTRRAATK